jgi:hypothetical protein
MGRGLSVVLVLAELPNQATIKELTEALKHEKNPIYRKAPEPSSNPSVAALQDELQIPRVVLEHLAERAAATAGIPPCLLLCCSRSGNQ